MADYISSLTGVAMDQALLDMAEHTSEAYAIGERNGVPVGSDDVAYHNNARYYAQQAQSIAPASVTEAVRWDVAQTALTDANRLQARENIKATSHNYNLLDNGWFLVNSRNATTVSTNYTYGADRWLLNTGSVTFAVGSMTLAASSNIGQRIDIPSGTYTASVKLSDGTIISGSGTVGNTTTTFISNSTVELDYFGTQSPRNFRIYNTSGSALTIVAAKIELGTFSTLANDTPPDYGEELTRCIYSTADPTDTYANNGFGRTNPNLLDNPFWGKNETINQRGFTSVTPTTAGGYTIDRWTAFSGSGTVGGITNTVAGITINNSVTGANTYIYFRQSMPTTLDLTGKVITASVMLTNGVVYYASGVVPAKTSAYQSVANIPVPNISAGFSVAPTSITTYNYLFQISVPSGRSIDIRAVKVELGTISTLANDTPPDYGTELAKCQRYYYRITGVTFLDLGAALAESATAWLLRFPLPVPMRVAPTTTTNGNFVLWNGAVGNACSAISTHTAVTPPTNPAYVAIKGTSSGMTTGNWYNIQARNQSTAYIEFSADL